MERKNEGQRHIGGKGIGVGNSRREMEMRKSRNNKEKKRHINGKVIILVTNKKVKICL